MSELSKASKATNWSKLQIKGAICNLRNVAKSFRVDSYQYDRCMSMLTKLEETLLVQVDRDYTELKSMLLKDRDTSKK